MTYKGKLNMVLKEKYIGVVNKELPLNKMAKQ
jgi:hypothetical protein